jgi:hypothetical protein
MKRKKLRKENSSFKPFSTLKRIACGIITNRSRLLMKEVTRITVARIRKYKSVLKLDPKKKTINKELTKPNPLAPKLNKVE